MRHFDGVHPRLVQGAGDGGHMLQRVFVADGVHAVAQGDVLDIETVCGGIEHGYAACLSSLRAAIFSAVFSAADVMISRLPA